MARTSPKPVRTLYRGTNADLLVDVARLYIPDGALVADVCWGRGVFWRRSDRAALPSSALMSMRRGSGPQRG